MLTSGIECRTDSFIVYGTGPFGGPVSFMLGDVREVCFRRCPSGGFYPKDYEKLLVGDRNGMAIVGVPVNLESQGKRFIFDNSNLMFPL